MYEPGAGTSMAQRFRGFLPVVVDVETGGFDPRTDALLEIAAAPLRLDDTGWLEAEDTVSTHVVPFEGANIDPKSLEVNGIDPWHPLRAARHEHDALAHIFAPVRRAVRDANCNRAILVGHNAALDLNFLNAVVQRAGIRRNPFHPFSFFDTVTLAGLAYGQTVLARAAQAAGLGWDANAAHSAVYDTQMTAQLFCTVINRWEALHARPTMEQTSS
jgi:ribonuclease T